MPFVIIIRADHQHFLMGDNTAHIIGFETLIEALEYFETTSRQDGLKDNVPMFPKRNGFKLFVPSIVNVPVFKELVQNILAKRPEPVLICTNSNESHVGITTQKSAKDYWERGRHKAMHWLRKGEHSANTKLKGREQEIIEFMLQGLKSEHIAKRMGVFATTVRQAIMMMDLEKRVKEIQNERKVNNGIHQKKSPRQKGQATAP